MRMPQHWCCSSLTTACSLSVPIMRWLAIAPVPDAHASARWHAQTASPAATVFCAGGTLFDPRIFDIFPDLTSGSLASRVQPSFSCYELAIWKSMFCETARFQRRYTAAQIEPRSCLSAWPFLLARWIHAPSMRCYSTTPSPPLIIGGVFGPLNFGFAEVQSGTVGLILMFAEYPEKSSGFMLFFPM